MRTGQGRSLEEAFAMRQLTLIAGARHGVVGLVDLTLLERAAGPLSGLLADYNLTASA